MRAINFLIRYLIFLIGSPRDCFLLRNDRLNYYELSPPKFNSSLAENRETCLLRESCLQNIQELQTLDLRFLEKNITNFHALEVVCSGSETQLQAGVNCNQIIYHL